MRLRGDLLRKKRGAHRPPASWREPLIAEVDGHPIGFLEIIDPAGDPDRYWGDVPPGLRALDIWIGEADALGRGHGTEMMRQALAKCFATPEVETVLVDPLADNVRALMAVLHKNVSPAQAANLISPTPSPLSSLTPCLPPPPPCLADCAPFLRRFPPSTTTSPAAPATTRRSAR